MSCRKIISDLNWILFLGHRIVDVGYASNVSLSFTTTSSSGRNDNQTAPADAYNIGGYFAMKIKTVGTPKTSEIVYIVSSPRHSTHNRILT
jgi:hypothetical protein